MAASSFIRKVVEIWRYSNVRSGQLPRKNTSKHRQIMQYIKNTKKTIISKFITKQTYIIVIRSHPFKLIIRFLNEWQSQVKIQR